ncbi:MAG: HDOD domain-containing protein [Planctomycetota bacterium]|jgi:diguanylate cyclase (GGDEF)-like protein
MPEAKTPSPRLRDDLHSIFARAKMPTNPAIALEILRLADDPGSSAEQFADVIRADVALSARLLEMANAAMYAQREQVTTIKRAVTLMGLRRIRMVALGFQLVSHLDRLGQARFDLKSFWQHSVLRACLAREIAARVVPTHAEESFVIGLLQDCGMLLLVQVLGDDYAALCGLQDLSPTAFYLEEGKRFSHDHVEAIRVVAEEWHLPEMIAAPLGHHHERRSLGPDSTDIERLSAVSYFVGSLPLICTLTAGSSEPALREYARSQLGLDEQAVSGCLEQAGEAYRHVAPLLPEQLPEDLDVTELLDRANYYLSRVATEAETRAEQVQADRDRIRQQQVQLKSALGQYRDRAAHDPLTRLLNRGALMEATLAAVRDCRDRNVALGVYFLDIDNFKSVNDEYGHHCGDEVLQIVAGTISETVVTGGFAGRYGGEEFVVVAPGLERDDARQAAEQLVEHVRNARVTMGGSPACVTCSVGAVWGHPGPATSPQDLFDAADELMYQAKLRGKDRCCFKSLPALDAGAEPAPDDHPAEDLHELALALNHADPDGFASMRKHDRRDLLTRCVVNCFVSGAPTVRSYPGHVRNISTGGAGLLTTRPMIRGEPVEVVIEQDGKSGVSLYLAGLVAFCRHVQDGIYDVGVQLVVQGREPILSREGGSADDHLDWVLEALRASHGTEAPYRESA